MDLRTLSISFHSSGRHQPRSHQISTHILPPNATQSWSRSQQERPTASSHLGQIHKCRDRNLYVSCFRSRKEKNANNPASQTNEVLAFPLLALLWCLPTYPRSTPFHSASPSAWLAPFIDAKLPFSRELGSESLAG